MKPTGTAVLMTCSALLQTHFQPLLALCKKRFCSVLLLLATHLEDSFTNSSRKVSFKSSSLLSPAPEDEGKTDSIHDSVSLQETLPELLTLSYTIQDFAANNQHKASTNEKFSSLGLGPSQVFAIATAAFPPSRIKRLHSDRAR